jgi:ATP-dependent exoDNAse (exonuclease V) beta subunit
MFAIDDATLFRYAHEVSRLHPFARPYATAPETLPTVFQPVRQALEVLAELHRVRNWRPIAETVNRLLEATRAHAGFALRPAGTQVLANVHRVADLARQFELSGGISFRGFVEELAAQAEKSEITEASVLEEGAEGVRMMTVHGAKGLEFPVVILADLSANLSASEPERFVDPEGGLCATRLLRCAPWELLEHVDYERKREDAEGVRVAYVAATRARDLLVVPVVGDFPPVEGSWLSPLSKAVYPEYMFRRQSEIPPGCPAFGEVTVTERPADHVSGPEEDSVRPGSHVPQAGSHRVVWWCPRALPLNVEPMLGLTQEEILAETGGTAGGIAAYQAWCTERTATRESGQRPSFDVFLATEARDLPIGFVCPVTLVALDHPPGRPTGKRFGSLVHDILRDVPLDGSAERVLELARLHGRILGSPEEELLPAVSSVLRVLEHDLIARTRRSVEVHREWPLLWRDGESVLEGVIDLAFLENGRWQIVDFKTDEDVLARLKQYETQLQWYSLALREHTGIEADCWLMGV